MLTLDPANHYSISATSVLRHIYDPLVEVTNDSKFVPCLAESWTPVNNTTWRFNLRKGVKFHDGTPVHGGQRHLLAEARPRDNTKLIKSFAYQDIDDVRKDGDFTVIVTTKRPFGSLPSHLTMLGMLPQTAAANEEAFFQKPVGTGPFKFGGWTHGEHHHPQRQRGLLEARHPQGREGDVPLHPGALDPRRRASGPASST